MTGEVPTRTALGEGLRMVEHRMLHQPCLQISAMRPHKHLQVRRHVTLPSLSSRARHRKPEDVLPLLPVQNAACASCAQLSTFAQTLDMTGLRQLKLSPGQSTTKTKQHLIMPEERRWRSLTSHDSQLHGFASRPRLNGLSLAYVVPSALLELPITFATISRCAE